MSWTVFYAWQSDRNEKTCRYFIRDAIRDAIKQVASEAKVEEAPALDHDTKGEVGLIHIAETIKKKIRRAGVFLVDLTFVGEYQTEDDPPRAKKATNANVAIELGYAMRAKDPRQFLIVMNTAHGRPEHLPFDLKHYRFPIQYELQAPNDPEFRAKQKMLTQQFADRLKDIIATGVIEESKLRAKQRKAEEEQQLLLKASARREGLVSMVKAGRFHGVRPPHSLVLTLIPLHPLNPRLNLASIDDTYVQWMRPYSDFRGTNNPEHDQTWFATTFRHHGAASGVPPIGACELHNDGTFVTAFDMHQPGPPLMMEPHGVSKEEYIPFVKVQRGAISHLANYVNKLREIGIKDDLAVGITLLGTNDLLLVAENTPSIPLTRKLSVGLLSLPDVIIQTHEPAAESNIERLLYPIFQQIWRAAGLNDDPLAKDGHSAEYARR